MSKVKKDTTCSEDYSSSSCTSSSLSSDEEVDARDLKPIKEYLSDRKELARQLLKSVKPEKIRMMLPQVLKKIDLTELEEWCASELSGMSKARILAILNGKPMLESSDTSESDDSGPSLEIISDTEEWLSDTEVPKKTDGNLPSTVKTKIKSEKIKNKGKSHLDKKNNVDKSKVKHKVNQKEESTTKQNNVHIKQEGEKEPNKEKDGDSLLDLLELEMRARAIRALIRKEEDIIPNSNTSNTNTNSTALKEQLAQEDLKEKENCRRQLEKIITSKQVNIGDDEDVVLVVQPTPTIELLSSESDGEGHGMRINQKLENERVIETEAKNKFKTSDTKGTPQSDKNEQDEQLTVSIPQSNNNSEEKDDEVKNNDNSVTSRKSSRSPSDHKQASVNKKQKLEESQLDVQGNKISPQESLGSKSSENKSDVNEKEMIQIDDNTSKSEENTKSSNSEQKDIMKVSRKNSTSEEDKLADFDEIINLDDYSDDMEDMESSDNKNKNDNKATTSNAIACDLSNKINPGKSGSAETWATRYYQTDDVQSVIKESKIQSEIRKRLRERQRLSKLNKTLHTNSSSISPQSDTSENKTEPKPTGSVEEYFALKNATSVNTDSDTNTKNNSKTDADPVLENNSTTTDMCLRTIPDIETDKSEKDSDIKEIDTTRSNKSNSSENTSENENIPSSSIKTQEVVHELNSNTKPD